MKLKTLKDLECNVLVKKETIKLLKKISKECGYDLHFSNVNISVKNKIIEINGIKK